MADDHAWVGEDAAATTARRGWERQESLRMIADRQRAAARRAWITVVGIVLVAGSFCYVVGSGWMG